MVLHRIPCFLLADGEHARFVWPAEDNALHTRQALDSATAHKQDSDLVSDREGRGFDSVTPTRHAYSPKHDPHDLEKAKFARLAGQKACALAAEGAFSELILVAPSAILAEIRSELDAATAEMVTGTLAKDLAGVPDDALQPHLAEWIRPVHRQE